jgi:integrase
MARAQPASRDRVLSDDELRQLWPALDNAGKFGEVLKLLLLTGQRRSEVTGMAWAEIEPDGTWTIPGERYKTGKVHSVPLSAAALDIIGRQPRTSEYVFRSRWGGPFRNYSKTKIDLDRTVPLPHWTLHDLRRTARTLMARAGVRPDIAERVVGHAQGGVLGVYDRHSYEAEKRDALEKLTAMIERILNPPGENVVPLEARR